jgi:hypothetical protein
MDESGSSREGTTRRNDVPSLWIDPITWPSQGRQAETVTRGCVFRRADGFAFAKPNKGAIALAAPWNALPRKPQLVDPTQKVYVDAVRDFLKTKGIKQAKVKIENILRVDLEGDGEEEVLINATNYLQKDENVPMQSPAGSYSMVLLRRVISGKVQTQLVEGEFYPKAIGYSAPNAYKVIAVLDLDGDGKLEVVVASQYYEGAATTIYRCDPKKVEALLSVGCGA